MNARRTLALVALAGLALVAIAPLLLLAITSSPAASTTDEEAEARFRELFGSSLTDQLVFLLDKREYHRHDTIGYRVENRTDQTIWFVDQSFGVRGFAYNENSQQWVELDLGFHVSEPMAKAIEPGRWDPLDYYALWIDRIDLPEDGRIRLVITGHTNLTVPALDQTYVAYADVEVVDWPIDAALARD
ncbi:MAG TPA: hypothetical protein VJ714_06050 [Anaerolineae bacterium]|nr:hypothetical protein [Anaerolineae bacterium]